MNEAFNPYREWLGLDAHIESPNYYELLGLPQCEADAARLLAAADRALVRVRGFRPGAQAAAWARLLDELAAAKRCLCDPQLKQAYDQSLRSGTRRSDERPRPTTQRGPEIAAVNLSPDLFPPGMAPRTEPAATPSTPAGPAASADRPNGPTAVAITKPKGHVAEDPHSADHAMSKPASGSVPIPSATVHNPVPPGPTPAGTAKLKPTPKHAVPPGQPIGQAETSRSREPDDSPESEAVHAPVPPGPVNAHVAPPRKEPTSLLPMVAIVASVVVIVTVIILVIALHDEQGGSPLVPQSPTSVPAKDPPSPKLGPFQPSMTQVAPTLPVDRRPASAPPSKTPTSIPTTVPPNTNAPAMAPPNETVANIGAATSGSDPADTTPSTENNEPSAAGDETTVPMVSDADGTASPDSVAATPAELKQLGQLLSRARLALSQHEFGETRRLVEQAGQLAKSEDHVALVDRLRMLAELAEQFWNEVATAARQLQATQEIQVGSGDLIVVVVETGPDWLIVRHQGQNTRYLVAELPPGLALAIARRSMKEGDPQTQLVFGAGLATVKDLKPVHLDEARKYWERAAAAGADATPLQMALTDQYELGE